MSFTRLHLTFLTKNILIVRIFSKIRIFKILLIGDFNFVRLGVMWEAVETSLGVYNETYL